MPSDTASSGVEAWKGKKHTSPRVQLWTLPPHCKTGSALQCLSGCVYCVLPRLPPIRSLTLLDNHAVAVPPSLPGWLRGAPEVMLLRDSSAPSTSQALPAVLCKREAVMHTVCPPFSLSLIRFAGLSAGGASRGNFIYVGQVNSCIMRAMSAMRA